MRKLLRKLRWRLYELPPRARPILLRVATFLGWSFLLGLVVVIFALAIWPDLGPDWTGFGKHDPNILRAKTLWDWMELLIVPIGLAMIAIWFNQKRRDTELEIASDRLRGEALQLYFDRMSDLLLEHNLYKADKNNDVRFIARARTFSTLSVLSHNPCENLSHNVCENHHR